MTDVYIYDAVRTPRGRGRADGSLHEVTALNLSTTTLNALKSRNGLNGHAVEDVIWGNVTQVGEQGACLARSAVLVSDLDESIPGLTINRFCASVKAWDSATLAKISRSLLSISPSLF